MNKNLAYIRYTRFVLVWIFVVILAGGVVRMTQSGMGCPDWPKCFGSWVPPTNASQLPADFEKYLSAQDIDHTFNAYHTWIEYINRLTGAVLGILVFAHMIWSFRLFFKKQRSIFWWSAILVVTTGFQGWLGKMVVAHNLAVVKVTTHMLVAIVIAAIPLIILALLNKNKVAVPAYLKHLTIAALILVIVQVILGTDVREQVDEISKPLGYQQRELWLNGLDNIFLLHRSTSWLVLAVCLFLWWRTKSFTSLRLHGNLTALFVLVALGAGLALYFFNMPAIMQPLHLLTACLLSVTLFSFRLQMK